MAERNAIKPRRCGDCDNVFHCNAERMKQHGKECGSKKGSKEANDTRKVGEGKENASSSGLPNR